MIEWRENVDLQAGKQEVDGKKSESFSERRGRRDVCLNRNYECSQEVCDRSEDTSWLPIEKPRQRQCSRVRKAVGGMPVLNDEGRGQEALFFALWFACFPSQAILDVCASLTPYNESKKEP